MNFKLSALIKNRFLKDSFYNLLALSVVIMAEVTINILIGNNYDLKDLGIYSYSFGLYTIFTTLTTLGLKTAAIKMVSEVKEDKLKTKTLIEKFFYSSLIIFVIASSIYLITTLLITYDVIKKGYLVFALVSIPFYSMNEIYGGIYAGLREMGRYALVRSFRWALITTSVLISITLKLNINLLLLSFTITEIILVIILIVDLLKNFDLKIKRYKIAQLKDIFWFGTKAVLTQSVNQIDNKLSLLLMGVFLSEGDLGLFGYASTITAGLVYIPGVIGLNFSPIISNLWSKNRNKLAVSLSEVKRISAVGTLLLTFLIGILYPFFINLTMKNSVYLETIPIFYVMLIGSAALALVAPYRGFLSMIGEPEEHLKIRAVSLAINTILAFVLINQLGLLGAAMATTLNNIIFVLLLNRKIHKKMKTPDIVK